MMYSPTHTQDEKLAALASGDVAATREVYNSHYRIITGWLIKHGADPADAADIYQEAMLVLYEKVQQPTFRLSCQLGTYLMAISKKLWYKKLERDTRRPDVTTGTDDENDWKYEDDINAHRERELHYEQLDAALGQLGEPCRSLLKAFYNEDKSMQQIAGEFGYTNPDNAKTQKYKCLTRLRKIFYSVQAK